MDDGCERCVDCRFFVYEDDGCNFDEGTCRRFPPTATYDEGSGWVHTVWPHVGWEDWCGEHRPRPWRQTER